MKDQSLESMNSLATSERTCIGFYLISDFNYGALIFGMQGIGDAKAKSIWLQVSGSKCIYLDEQVLNYYNIEDAPRKHVSVCFNEDSEFYDAGMLVKSNLNYEQPKNSCYQGRDQSVRGAIRYLHQKRLARVGLYPSARYKQSNS